MFDWFTSSGDRGASGLEKMRAEFGQMLDAGRHVFDTAANAFLGGLTPHSSPICKWCLAICWAIL